MELKTIEMPVKEAREKFLEYRRAVQARHDDEDAAIMKGYKALSLGKRLLELRPAILRGGFDRMGLPRLAVVRSDAQQCHLRIDGDGEFVFTDDGDTWRSRHRSRFTFPADSAPRMDRNFRPLNNMQYKAMVPLVPAALRPRGSLSRYFTLFEVEEWTKVRPPAPRDPALLRHLAGDLYVVVALWNLTDLERAVLGTRAGV